MRDELLISKFEFILESISLIQIWFSDIKNPDDYLATSVGRSHFDATLMRLQSIGETLKKIDAEHPTLLNNYKGVVWREIIKLRELISHHYEQLNHEIIFGVCRNHLPALKAAVESAIADRKKG